MGLVAAGVLSAACSAGTSPPAVSLPASVATSPSPAAAVGIGPQLQTVTQQLDASIDAWRAGGGTMSWPPPTPLVVQAVTQQKIFGTLGLHPQLLAAVLPHLPGDLRVQTQANATAAARLLSLITPSTHHVTLKTQAPPPAGVLLDYFKQAQQRFGVPWEILAAVNLVESRFGRVVSNSSAGAQGPMQFIPATWAAYGLGGDVHDPHDAIMGAANYLHASGSPGDDAGALYHYNPAPAYVRAVMLYAHEMMRDPRTYYAYYNWQVFTLTPHGLVQLTGPGR